MATFLDELARLNSQNFLGGLAQVGQAVKEQRQNEKLVDLYNEFKMKRSGLETTDQQLAEFNKEVIGSDGLKPDNITKTMDAIQSASLNLQKIYSQVDVYNQIYQPYITAFATLGEEGVRVANTLSRELDSRKEMLERKGEIPLRELEYKKNILDFTYTYNRVQEFNRQLRENEEVREAYGQIVKSDLFNSLPAGKVDYITEAKNQRYATTLSAIKEAVKKNYPKLSDEIINMALSKALKDTNREVSYDEYKGVVASTRGEDETKQFDDPFIVNSALQNLRYGTSIYQSIWYNPSREPVQRAIDKVIKSGWNPTTINEVTGEAEANPVLAQLISEYIEWFRPGGKYDESQDILRAVYSKAGKNWDMLKSQGKGLPSSPVEHPEIMRYSKPGGALDYELSYHPYWNEQALKNKESELQQGQEQSLVQTEEGSFWDWAEENIGLYRELSMSKDEKKEYERKQGIKKKVESDIKHYKNRKDLGTITVREPK